MYGRMQKSDEDYKKLEKIYCAWGFQAFFHALVMLIREKEEEAPASVRPILTFAREKLTEIYKYEKKE